MKLTFCDSNPCWIMIKVGRVLKFFKISKRTIWVIAVFERLSITIIVKTKVNFIDPLSTGAKRKVEWKFVYLDHGSLVNLDADEKIREKFLWKILVSPKLGQLAFVDKGNLSIELVASIHVHLAFPNYWARAFNFSFISVTKLGFDIANSFSICDWLENLET